MEDPTSEEQILQHFTEMVKGSLPSRVVTNFIIIAEVVGSSDNELTISTSDGMTPWLASGMLRAGVDMVMSGHNTFTNEEDYDGE